MLRDHRKNAENIVDVLKEASDIVMHFNIDIIPPVALLADKRIEATLQPKIHLNFGEDQ